MHNEKMKSLYFIISLSIELFLYSSLLATTDVDYDFSLSGETISLDGLDELATQFQDRADLNGPYYAIAFAFPNILNRTFFFSISI